ncbi:MAG: nucleoside deaminase [Magnetococcales bacterium]|nr:nucleoside deaminase [Magnetococcales bacterium]
MSKPAVRFLSQDDSLAYLALVAASKAGQRGEVPVGAVLCDPVGRVLSESGNQTVHGNDPLGHAELRALRQGAERMQNYRLSGCRLVITLEPCAMCVAALETARIFQWTFLAGSDRQDRGSKPYETRRWPWGSRPIQLASARPFRDVSAALLRFFFEQRR